MKRRRRYYEPEELGANQDRRDVAIDGRQYYIYVLDTDYGHYVGHSSHVGRRLREHQEGQTPSTAYSNPELVWTSGPLTSRADAARFEAAMKALRDQQSYRFEEITGLEPIPFRPIRYAPAGGNWRWVKAVIIAAAVVVVVWLLVNAGFVTLNL